MRIYSHRYHSPLGDIVMTGDGDFLTGLYFDGQKNLPDSQDMGNPMDHLSVFHLTDMWLDIYFKGRNPGFTPPLIMKSTKFRQEVWEILLTISYGKTMTYGEIARIIAEKHGMSQMSPQAVGGAVGHNVISIIIPCHRVVGSDGSLTGYAGGIERKAALLRLEGIEDFRMGTHDQIKSTVKP